MPLQKGDRYRCSNPECSAEIVVTRGVAREGMGSHAPRCSCGSAMTKVTRPSAVISRHTPRQW